MTRPCTWILLPRFVLWKFLRVLLFVLLFVDFGFRAGSPLPVVYLCLVSSPADCVGESCPAGEYSEKRRGRTLRHRSPAPAGGYFILGGLGTASCKTLGGAGWGLAVGSLLKGFYRPVGEVRARRLAPATTWVARPTDFPVCTFPDHQTRDTRGRMRSRSVGDNVTLIHAVLVFPVDPTSPN